MERTVQEVHGSLQVTLPKQLAERSGITKGTRLRFEASDAGFLVRPASATERILWTLGYEGETVASFVQALRERGIETLVDIRELPLSRRRGFSKTPLAAALGKAGIQYHHVRALGAPGPIRRPFVAGGDFGTFRDGYLNHLASAEAPLSALARTAATRRTAIMCVERSHGVCHRQFVAQALAEQGFEIRHIQSSDLR